MNDYTLYFFKEKFINSEGELLLPIEKNFEKNLTSKLLQIDTNNVISIENIDLPIEKEFLVKTFEPDYPFFDNFGYSKNVQDLIHFDNVKKCFVRNDVEIDELYIDMKLFCKYAIIVPKVILQDAINAPNQKIVKLYSNIVDQDIPLEREVIIRFKLLKYVKTDKNLSKKIEIINKDLKKEEIYILDIDKLKTNNELRLFIDTDKTKDFEYPSILIEKNKLTYYHCNSQLFHDYFTGTFFFDWSNVFIQNYNPSHYVYEDLKLLNYYNLLHCDELYKMKYNADEDSRDLSYVESNNLFLLFGIMNSVSDYPSSLTQKIDRDTKRNTTEVFKYSSINTGNSTSWTWTSGILSPFTNADLNLHRYTMFNRAATAFSLNVVRHRYCDNPSANHNPANSFKMNCNFRIFVPYLIGNHIFSTDHFFYRYFTITHIKTTDLINYAGFKQKDIDMLLKITDRMSVIKRIPNYEQKGINYYARLTYSLSAILREEVYYWGIYFMLIHFMVPAAYRNTFVYYDWYPSYKQNERIRRFRNYFKERKQINSDCRAIEKFQYYDSNILKLGKANKEIDTTIENWLKTESDPTSTAGIWQGPIEVDINESDFILKDFHFEVNNNRTSPPKFETDPYINFLNENIFLYFDYGNSISFPSQNNLHRSLMSTFNYTNKNSHKIDSNNYVSITKRDSRCSTQLKEGINIDKLTFIFRNTTGQPLKQIVKNNVSLPSKNILLSIGFDNFITSYEMFKTKNKSLKTQYCFFTDVSEFPLGDYTTIEFNSINDIFLNLEETFSFANKSITCELESVSLPTFPTLNSEEESIYFVCIKGCNRVNPIKIDKQDFYIVGILNISQISNEWNALKTKKSRYSFILKNKNHDNVALPFILQDIRELNKSALYILNSKKQIVNYKFDKDGNSIDKPPTPTFTFKFEVYDEVQQ